MRRNPLYLSSNAPAVGQMGLGVSAIRTGGACGFPTGESVQRTQQPRSLHSGRSVSPGVKHATYEVKVESRNMGTLIDCSASEPSSPQRLEMVGQGTEPA